MESSVRPELYRDLADWGYGLIRFEKRADPGELLRELVKTDEVRLLEGFPVVLTSWLTESESLPIRLDQVESGLESAGEKKRFRLLVASTWQLLGTHEGLEESRQPLREYLQSEDSNLMAAVRSSFAEGRKLNLGRIKLSPERLQTTFDNYVVATKLEKQERIAEQIVRVREIAFNEALSELFADRQAEIVRKILARQALTKTEREYFSRVIKKRLAAIANPDMQTLATSLAGRPDAFIKSVLNVADED